MSTSRFTLAILGTLALIPAAAAQTHGPVRLPPAQSAAADRLARQLVDGDTNRQVFTPEYAARRCYRAAKSNPSNRAGQPDRDGLTPRQRSQFIACVAADGFRLRRV